MYLKMFGLHEKPFHITPNPRFIFLSKNHKEAFAHLLYGIQQRVGFLSLTGEVGTGKTTVLRTLLAQLEEADYRVALIFNPCLNARELLQAIHQEFAIDSAAETANLAQLHDSLNRFLLQQCAAGKTVVLVIDEAQNLDPSVLEQLRLLSNLETETEKLLQLVLVGQPELERILQRNDLRQLRQRLAVRYRLHAMDAEDTAAYVRHRLKVAGSRDGELFAGKALQRVYKFTGGIPRLINILCDRTLLVAYGGDTRTVSPREVRVAQGELGQQPATRRKLMSFSLPALALLVLLIVFGSRFFSVSQAPLAELALTAGQQPGGATQEVAAATDVAPSELAQLKMQIAALTPEESLQQAFVALAELWQQPAPAPLPQHKSVSAVKAALHEAGYAASEMQTEFADLVRLNTPVILKIVLPGIPGNRFFTLTAVRGSSVRLDPALTESGWLDRNELAQIWFGRAILPYRNYQDIATIKQPGQRGEQVRALQGLLRLAGAANLDSGVYDRQTIEVVTRFQAAHRLAPDGWVGTRTLFWLYREAGLRMPRLTTGGAS